MKPQFLFSAVFVLLIFTSCENKKAEIVEVLKKARKHVDHATTRLQAIKDTQELELRMIRAHTRFKPTPLDSTLKYLEMSTEERRNGNLL